MAGFPATIIAVLINGLVLLGVAFILSRGFPWLRTWPGRQRTVLLAAAFGAMTIGSMMLSFPMGEGFIGDLRNVVIAVAAIVGGPVAALVAAAAAAVYRVSLGGQSATAVFGIAVVAGLAIGFARTNLPRTPRNLAVLGVVMAIANALLLPIASLLFSTTTFDQSAQIGATFFSYAVLIYPIGIVVIGGLLKGEQQRADDEADLKALNTSLSLHAARDQGVFQSSSVAMAWADLASGRFIEANPQYARFTGYSEAELLTMRFDELAAPEDRESDFAAIGPLQTGDLVSLTDEKRYLRKDGSVVWALRSLTAVGEGGGNAKPRYIFAMLQDITERKRAREEIALLASLDSLTGLFNRLVFHTELAEAMVSRRTDEMVAVLCLDLDDFKTINDTLGHPAGDAILIALARRLRAAVAPGDIVARFGGDEFAILRRGVATEAEIRALAQMLFDRLTRACTIEGRVVTPRVNVGISLGPRDGRNADELIKKSDIALHTAKTTGKPYLFFEPEMEERLIARQDLKVDLTAALSNGELRIEYQPSIDLRTGAVTSFEALLRWQHPLRGLVSPSEFIPLAEETGLIGPIGDWVLNQACREAMNWPVAVSVAVNVSSAQFRGRLFALRVAEVLANSGLSPTRLELEITETLLLHGSAENLRILSDLHQLGLKVALDDFGTGYSSLGYLQLFSFDRIKIDRSFIAELATRPESQALVRAVIELGHSLNMRITAEGVETAEQLDRISAKGCDEAQGFLFSQSVPPHEVRALIARLAPPAGVRIGAAG